MEPKLMGRERLRQVLQLGCSFATCSALLSSCIASAFAAEPHWVVSWAASPCAYAEAEPRHNDANIHNETLREIVHLSIGGIALRVRFANTFGSKPLAIGAAGVALASTGAAIDPATQAAITVGGKANFVVPPGGIVVSDPINVTVPSDSDLAISLFIPNSALAGAIHYTARQASWTADGNQVTAATLTKPFKNTLWMIVNAVDVATRTAPYAVVAIGSSTTDGAHSTENANRRWTDDLSRRLDAADGAAAPGVVNEGISGNRVLHDGRGDWGPVWGEAAIKRFPRDVLTESGVGYVIAFEGGNDIRQPGSGAVPLSETITPQQLIAGFELMAQGAHARGLKFIVGTITPFGGASSDRFQDPQWEKTRLAFNRWVRSTHDIDGVVDFDAAIRDPKHPSRILAQYDSGDHLHPNDAGYQAMADSIDLSLFSQTSPKH